MNTKKMTNEQKRFHAEHEIITEINELGQFARIDKYNRGVSTWSRFVKRYDILNSWPDFFEWLKANYWFRYEADQPMTQVHDIYTGHMNPRPVGFPDIKIIVKKKEISK